MWASFSFFTIGWTYFVLPEMKGFSLEQLDYLFNNRVSTRKFKSYVFVDQVLAVQEKEIVEVVTDLGHPQSLKEDVVEPRI